MAAQSLRITSTVAVGDKNAAMPRFGLGTWQAAKEEVASAVLHAIKSGYRHLDCAAVYQNEDAVGEGIAAAIAQGVCTRADLWVTSKLWLTNFQPSRVRAAFDKTAKDLKLTYLDQYLLHWPIALEFGDSLWPKSETGELLRDASVNICDTWKEMEKLCDAGLAKTIGVSNFNIEEIKMIVANCQTKPAVNQVECHPCLSQNKLRAIMKENNMQLVAYCPLGGQSDERPVLNQPVILEIAAAKKKSPAQVCIRWGLQIGNVVIPKSTNPQRIIENSEVFDFSLSDDEMTKIANMGVCRRHVNPPFAPGGRPFFPEE